MMAALEPRYMSILKKVLAERFVPFLPPLLGAAKPEDRAAKQLSRAFSAFVLHKLFDITPQSAAASVVDDFNDKGIDAVHYDENSATLCLLQTKLKESEQFKQEDALPFCEGIRSFIRQDFAGFNQNFQNRKTAFETALEECGQIRLVVPYTGDGISKTASDALQALLDDEIFYEERLIKHVEYYTAAEIVRDLLAEQTYAPVHTEIALQKHVKVEIPRTTYYGIARLADLIALHQDKGKALYERNIRYFLGSSRSDVNKSIKATLSDEPASFFYLNNGVTAVCDEIEPKGNNPNGGFRKFKVRGLSIINGAQTVASAAEFVAQHPGSNIDDAKVMFTLIKAPADGAFGKRVTKARNHQNTVQAANFASLDETQERLRQEIAHFGFAYHYRPEASVGADASQIRLDEAIRAFALQKRDSRYPAWVKGDFTRLSNSDGAEYQALFDANTSGQVLVNSVLLYRAIRDLVVTYDRAAPAGSQERLIYRHGNNVIASVMLKRLRSRIHRTEVIDDASINALIGPHLDELRQQAANLGPVLLGMSGPWAFFKNQGNVAAFLTSLMAANYGLAVDATVAHLSGISSPADAYPRKALIDYLSDRAPQL